MLPSLLASAAHLHRPPLARASREEDYRVAWAYFEEDGVRALLELVDATCRDMDIQSKLIATCAYR